MHECSQHEENCFITLTYNEENLPKSLQLSDWQKFMKRLRKSLEPRKIKFFHCGEYGEEKARPHYHAIVFGHDFGDKKLWKIINDNPVFTSETLSGLWPWGFSSLGAATFSSAAYVARYVLKKRTGQEWERHYEYYDQQSGEIFRRMREYTTMSQGIGAEWYEKYATTDAHRDDFIVMRGAQMKLPKYYDKLYENHDPKKALLAKAKRKAAAGLDKENQTPARLRVREKVQQARVSLLPRKLEDE